MLNTILGTKIRQTQTFTSEGERLPVTEVQAGPCFVVQVKTEDKDGYNAIQLGFGIKKEKKFTKPVLGHLKKADKPGLKIRPRFLREIKMLGEASFKVGDEIKAGEFFKPGDIVGVTGVSKGKGFTGVVKRWGFAGGPRTHGQSDRERAPGSIGATTTPGRVLKGKKMAGRHGGARVTVKNLKIMEVDSEKNILKVMGLVPGAKGGLLIIKKLKNGKGEKNAN